MIKIFYIFYVLIYNYYEWFFSFVFVVILIGCWLGQVLLSGDMVWMLNILIISLNFGFIEDGIDVLEVVGIFGGVIGKFIEKFKDVIFVSFYLC